MTNDTSSSNPGSFPKPKGASRLLFEGTEFRYEFIRTLDEHQEYEHQVVAERRPLQGGASQTVLLKRVAMPPVEERRQRAAEEVHLAARLHHPNISRVLALEEHEGAPYVVMEYVPGCFLATAMDAALLQRRKLLSPAFACYIAAEVADALHYAHHSEGEAGQPLRLVHRAVSPTSIRLGLEGQVKLSQFGVARSELPGRLRTPPRVLRADLAYAAPEVFRFEGVDGRADLYSLGLVLLEMLTGRYPLDPSDITLPPGEPPEAERYTAEVRTEWSAWAPAGELACRVQSFGPEDVERAARELPESLKRLLHKALRRNPADRYQAGGELRDELRNLLRSLGQPFGLTQAAEELATLLQQQSLDEIPAYPTEQGVVPAPEETELKTTLH